MTYASYTRDTKEPLKRIAHGRRFRQVVELIASPLSSDTVLDYGCGDAHLFSLLQNKADRLVGYDPDPALLAQALNEVASASELTTDIDALKSRYMSKFSLIYCMEVCEHLTEAALDQLIDNLRTLAAPHARVVFGVPIETGIPGFLKGMYRVTHDNRQFASFGNSLKALFNIPIERRTTDVEWYGAHTGFRHRHFRQRIEAAGFKVRSTRCLPFPILGQLLNNEVYYVTRKSTKTAP